MREVLDLPLHYPDFLEDLLERPRTLVHHPAQLRCHHVSQASNRLRPLHLLLQPGEKQRVGYLRAETGSLIFIFFIVSLLIVTLYVSR